MKRKLAVLIALTAILIGVVWAQQGGTPLPGFSYYGDFMILAPRVTGSLAGNCPSGGATGGGMVFCFDPATAALKTSINGGAYSSATDGTFIVPPQDCSPTIGATGTLAAAVLTGNGNSGANPGIFRVAAGNYVMQAITTGAANNLNLNCDITPPSKLTAGHGVTINNVQLFYGVQTTALTSITAPTINSVTYPATGAAAGATVSTTAGGTLTVTPGSLQLTTTTTGQCFSENIALGTPINVVTDLQRIHLEQIFNQTGAAATTLQVCGAIVHYTQVPL